MSKSSASKLFFGFLLIFSSSCSLWRARETATPSPTPFVATEIKSGIPFSTAEPEIYQAVSLSQVYSSAGKTERKIFIARNGAKRLTVFNVDEKDEVSQLAISANQIFLIRRDKKIYTELQPNSASATETAIDFLNTELLNQKTPATFEALGAENGLQKFRVKLGNAENANSEIFIYVDENLKIPVKQEFYAASGEQKTLTYSVETRDFKTEAADNLFELPKDFRKVSADEFQEIAWQEKLKK